MTSSMDLLSSIEMMMLVENESRSDIDAASLAKVCNKGEKLNANQLARKLLQGGGTRPSRGITKCPKCGHGNMDEPPENKAARRAIRELNNQWSEDRQSIEDFLGGNSDVCLPVDSKGRQITDPKKIGNPSKLPKELVVVSCILYHTTIIMPAMLELTILLLMSVSLQGTCQLGCWIRLPQM